MGLSGSGKSTLLRHVNRLIEPTAGKIIIDGRDVNALTQKELRTLRSEKVAMVFQNVALLPHRTVRDNVAYGLEVRGVDKQKRSAIAMDMLKLVQLDGWQDRYPDELSGGMQQRVGLARALAVDPDILLMDEPFSALDPIIRRELQDEFLRLSAVVAKTTIFITHDLNEAIRLGRRIAIMREGRFVQVGTPEEIFQHPKDEHVAEFIRDISPLAMVHAGAIMLSLDEYRRGRPKDLGAAPRVPASMTLDKLIDVSVKSEDPLVVVDEAGNEVGVVTRNALLVGIKGRRQGESRNFDSE
jgi:glycine betaine/proline transport system ATP-binding protein